MGETHDRPHYLTVSDGDPHPDLWGFGDGKRAFFWLKQGGPPARRTTSRHAHGWNTIPDTMPPTSSTRMVTPSRSYSAAPDDVSRVLPVSSLMPGKPGTKRLVQGDH